LLVVLPQSIFIGDGWDEAARPALLHGLPERVELVEAAIDFDGAVAILALEEVHGELRESTAFLEVSTDFESYLNGRYVIGTPEELS
jgi:hypothetical protein